MNTRSIKAFHKKLPPGSSYALVISPPYGCLHLLKDFGFNPEQWIGQLLGVIESEFCFIPTPTAIYFIINDGSSRWHTPSSAGAFRNVHFLETTESIPDTSIAFLTPFISNDVISFLRDKIQDTEYNIARFQYYTQNNIEAYFDVPEYINSASNYLEILTPYVLEQDSHTFTRKELSRYILENGVLPYIEKSEAHRVSLDIHSHRSFAHYINDIEESSIVCKYSVDSDPEISEYSTIYKFKHIILSDLIYYDKEKYWPVIEDVLQRFSFDQYLISIELYKDTTLRKKFDFSELNLKVALRNSELHTAVFLFSLSRTLKHPITLGRTLITENALKELLSNYFIFDINELRNNKIFLYGYQNAFLYTDFWYDYRGPYLFHEHTGHATTPYAEKNEVNELTKLRLEKSREDLISRTTGMSYERSDVIDNRTTTQVTRSDYEDNVMALTEFYLTEQDADGRTNPSNTKVSEDHKTPSKEFGELQNEVKHEIANRVRRGVVGKSQYLHIAWKYRTRHPGTSRAQCLEDFKMLVGQPIVGWKDETAARTFKRYYSEKKLGYVPTDHKDHGYTPVQDLEFIRDYIKEEWPDPDGDGV